MKAGKWLSNSGNSTLGKKRSIIRTIAIRCQDGCEVSVIPAMRTDNPLQKGLKYAIVRLTLHIYAKAIVLSSSCLSVHAILVVSKTLKNALFCKQIHGFASFMSSVTYQVTAAFVPVCALSENRGSRRVEDVAQNFLVHGVYALLGVLFQINFGDFDR